MALKLYCNMVSQPSRSIFIFLKLNDIPFDMHIINLAKGEQKKEDFTKINPLGVVPVIDDGGFILRESVGILRYLVREKKVADHWYPKKSKAQARVDEFLEWQHVGLRRPLTIHFRTLVREPMMTGKKPEESVVKSLEEVMVASCDLFERLWVSSERKFIFGDHLSIADLLAVMELEQPRMTGYDPRTGRPNLAAYMDRVRTETNPHYDEACKAIYSISESRLKNKQ